MWNAPITVASQAMNPELELTFKQLAPAPAPAPLEFQNELQLRLQLLWKSLAPGLRLRAPAPAPKPWYKRESGFEKRYGSFARAGDWIFSYPYRSTLPVIHKYCHRGGEFNGKEYSQILPPWWRIQWKKVFTNTVTVVANSMEKVFTTMQICIYTTQDNKLN